MVSAIEFTIPGLPISQPRQRYRVRGKFVQNYTPGTHPVQTFKATCRLVAAQQSQKPILGPVEVEIAFLFPRPINKVWKTRPMPREAKTTKPDLDNLAKAVLDALKGVCWTDDAQVSRLVVSKWIAAHGEPSCSMVRVREIEK